MMSQISNMQGAAFEVEAFLTENYQFRNNVLSGKQEFRPVVAADSQAPANWQVVTSQVVNTLVRNAKLEGIGGKSSPRQNIEEYIGSCAIPDYDPIGQYLEELPVWDGRNRVAELFGRIPGMTCEQLGWCATWLRSAVAHWKGMDTLHGNECVPVLIGHQGCGKSTFAVRLLPPSLRVYFLDHINFGNKFDSDMALTHNLLVNIDEFANMGGCQQGKLKQTLSKVKVNGRPIFGKSQEDRRRYASFMATTNDEHPLCDPTGSRRFLCLRIPQGAQIDNVTDIEYDQLYAQVLHELKEGVSYWFNNEQVARIQATNLPYFKSDDMESMLSHCYRLPQEDEHADWLPCSDIFKALQHKYPVLLAGNATKIRIGQTLKYLGCKSKHTKHGVVYQLIPLAA